MTKSEETKEKKSMPPWAWKVLGSVAIILFTATLSYTAGVNKSSESDYFGPASCVKAFVAVDDYLKNTQAELSSALTDTPVKDKVSVEEVAKLRKQCVGELPVVKTEVSK